MEWREHSKLKGLHAFLAPSNYHWVNYSDEKLLDVYSRRLAAEKGDELHALAANCIKHGVKLQRSRKTMNSYVNDAIGFKMRPEQPLYYSPVCFGTADAISFRNDFLRIHDLKTGVTPASLTQLKVYAAIFCLEYAVNPNKITGELRIYQNDEIQAQELDSLETREIMDKIVHFSDILERLEGREV